jgi:MFS family permease
MPTESHHTLEQFISPPRFKKLPGLMGLYLNASLRSFSISLTGIFIPIYIYQQTHSLPSTIFYFLIWQFTHLVTVIPASVLISRLGPDISNLISGLFRAFYLLFLILVPRYPSLLFPSAILGAITVPLYWLPYYLAFSRQSKRNKIGRQINNISFLQRIASALAPFTGGLITAFFGFNAIYTIAIIILFLSSLPILFDEYDQKDPWPGLKKIIQGQKDGRLSKYTKAFFGNGIETGFYGIIWPLFLFVFIKDLKAIGFISTVALITTLFAVKYVGSIAQKRPRRMIKFGTISMSSNLILRTFLLNPFFLFLGDVLYQLSSIFVWIPFDSYVYSIPKKNTYIYFIDREISIVSGKILGLLIALLFLKLGIGLPFLSLLGVLGLFLVYSWSRSNLDDCQD